MVKPSYKITYEKFDKSSHVLHFYRLYKNDEEVLYLKETQEIPDYKNQIYNYYKRKTKILFDVSRNM